MKRNKSNCPRSYSNEHSYEPIYNKKMEDTGRIKCVLCGFKRKVMFAK